MLNVYCLFMCAVGLAYVNLAYLSEGLVVLAWEGRR